MGSCVSRRKPHSQKKKINNAPVFEPTIPTQSDQPTIKISAPTVVDNNTKAIAKFFTLNSLPSETVNLLSGRCKSIDVECKNEIKLYISATFTGI